MGKGLIFLILSVFLSLAYAQDAHTYIPAGAHQYAPILVAEQRTIWPAMNEPWTLAGLVEQESCVTLKSSRCWNPRAELKTVREYGFGFGQITKAYRADGSVRFDKFKELTATYANLHDWEWAQRYDPKRQLDAIVDMNLSLWRRIPPAATVDDHLAFMLSSDNGGVAGVLQDRVLCSHTAGCDPGRWFGNVERVSVKSRVPQPIYGGRSWFDINRSYVYQVLLVRRDKYAIFWEP